MLDEILSALPPEYPWADRLLVFPSLDSTNTRLKELARQGAPEGTALIAHCQTGGRGRLGRQFQSPEGMGVYLSLLLRFSCPPSQLMHLTCAVGSAMCDAVESAAGFRPGIKWTNDLVWQGKKLGGILVELTLDTQGKIACAVAGIGINCCQKKGDFPPELQDMAASLAMTGHPVRRSVLAAAMLEALWKLSGSLFSRKEAMLAQYRRDCITIGQDICLIRGQEQLYGRALDVDDQGALVVAFPDGTVRHVSSGEVSVRGMYGYI